MPTKNEIARLRKVQANLNKILDELHQAQGTLYPEGLRSYRDGIGQMIKQAQGVLDKIKLPPTVGPKPKGAVVQGQDDLVDFDTDEPEEAA